MSECDGKPLMLSSFTLELHWGVNVVHYVCEGGGFFLAGHVAFTIQRRERLTAMAVAVLAQVCFNHGIGARAFSSSEHAS